MTVDHLGPVLDQLFSEVASLRAMIAVALPGSEGPEAELLRALCADGITEASFTAAEVIEHSRTVASAFLLRATLQALQIDTPKSLGRMLARIENRQIGGRVVRRVGAEAAGIVWSVA